MSDEFEGKDSERSRATTKMGTTVERTRCGWSPRALHDV